MDGVLVIDKPAGPTSHDVVARARRVLGETRIGHTGTLDPLATGVLPLVIGRATRLASLLSATDKEYDAAVRLGAATQTYDAAGRHGADIPSPPDPPVDAAQVQRALGRFRGTFPQMPPFSAKKVGGVPAYKLARKQKPTDLSPVAVTVHALTMLGLEAGLLRLHLVSSAGFYVRSLAHDLGADLGCGAHLEALRRTRAGRFGIDEAVTLGDLERDPEAARTRLIGLDALVPDIPAVQLNERGARRASHGNSLTRQDLLESGPGPVLQDATGESGTGPLFAAARVRLIDPTGRLLGIAEAHSDGLLRPTIVLV